MTIAYYGLLLVLAILMIMPSRVQAGFFYLLCGYMLLLAGFRDGVGTDYEAYRQSFETLDFWYEEAGFVALINVLAFAPFSAQLAFFVCAMLILALILSFFYKESHSKQVFFLCVFFFITFYYFHGSLNVMRQYVAIGFFLWSLYFAARNRWLSYHMLFAVSVLFHSSALLFYPIFLIPKLMAFFNTALKRSIALCMAFCLMFVKFDELIILLVLNNSTQYEVYAKYLAADYLQYDLSWKMLAVLTGKFFIYQWLMIEKEQFIKSAEQQFYFQLFFFASLLLFPLYPMLIFRRLLFYVLILEVLIFSYFAAKNRWAKYVLVVFSLLYFFAYLLSGVDTPLPYRWNFSIFK